MLVIGKALAASLLLLADGVLEFVSQTALASTSGSSYTAVIDATSNLTLLAAQGLAPIDQISRVSEALEERSIAQWKASVDARGSTLANRQQLDDIYSQAANRTLNFALSLGSLTSDTDIELAIWYDQLRTIWYELKKPYWARDSAYISASVTDHLKRVRDYITVYRSNVHAILTTHAHEMKILGLAEDQLARRDPSLTFFERWLYRSSKRKEVTAEKKALEEAKDIYRGIPHGLHVLRNNISRLKPEIARTLDENAGFRRISVSSRRLKSSLDGMSQSLQQLALISEQAQKAQTEAWHRVFKRSREEGEGQKEG